jgi:poly(3-hydroxybutyrate) depolymerase
LARPGNQGENAAGVRTIVRHVMVRSRLVERLWMALLASAFAITCSGRELPALNVDLAETSVSGLSSGAFMAVQFEVANSAMVKGVGVFAGGPYYCGQDDAIRATTQCSCSLDLPFPTCDVSSTSADVPHLEDVTRASARDGAIDPTDHLADHRVFIFTGGKDSIVPGAIAAQLEEYYRRFAVPAGNINKTVKANAAHTMPTRNYGTSCSVSDTPYMGRCGFDGAHAALSWIYGGLNAPRRGTRRGRFIRFDQKHYVPSVAPFAVTGMDATAWLYVPAACARGERCRLHIALHGCKQAQSYTPLKGAALHYGTKFVRHAGYVETADTNRIVVLFPQAVGSPENIFGCWDWWGYTGADYATRDGVQIATIRAMAEQIASGLR